MNKERIKLLVDALRSGKYQQGRKTLRSGDNKFCCLGVACDIYHQQTGLGEWKPNEDNRFAYFEAPHARYGMNASYQVLPDGVIEWYGFNSSNPSIKVESNNDVAAQINDDGASFETIAKGFEEQYLNEPKKDEDPV